MSEDPTKLGYAIAAAILSRSGYDDLAVEVAREFLGNDSAEEEEVNLAAEIAASVDNIIQNLESRSGGSLARRVAHITR